jgi:hypothetical protein
MDEQQVIYQMRELNGIIGIGRGVVRMLKKSCPEVDIDSLAGF